MKKIIRKGLICVLSVGIVLSRITTVQAATCKLFGTHWPDGADRYSWIKDVGENFETYTNYSVYKDEYFSSSCLKQNMNIHNVIFVCSHGDSGGVWTRTQSGKESALKIEDLDGVDLKNLKLCFLNVCETAKGGGAGNFASKVRTQGADTVVGFKEQVYTNRANDFTKKFAEKITKNKMTVLDALVECDFEMKEDYPADVGKTDSWKIYGRKYQVFSAK